VILVDTSVWVDHFRGDEDGLADLLESGQVLIHPFIIGELALGQLRQRAVILEDLRALPSSDVATDEEVLHFIDSRAIFGRGIGYVDAHLLAAVTLTAGANLWTRDRRLASVAAELDLAASPPQ